MSHSDRVAQHEGADRTGDTHRPGVQASANLERAQRYARILRESIGETPLSHRCRPALERLVQYSALRYAGELGLKTEALDPAELADSACEALREYHAHLREMDVGEPLDAGAAMSLWRIAAVARAALRDRTGLLSEVKRMELEACGDDPRSI